MGLDWQGNFSGGGLPSQFRKMSGAVCPGKAENMTKAEEKESKQTFLADMLARLIPVYDDTGYALGNRRLKGDLEKPVHQLFGF
jgi:hypothetical protein